jgi:hypothetical protein
LQAASKTGAIKRIDDNQAIISLGSKDGILKGLNGEIFREGEVGEQKVTLKLAELIVFEVYADSAKIEIRKRMSPIELTDKVRVKGVVEEITIEIKSEDTPISEATPIEIVTEEPPLISGGESLFKKKWFWPVVGGAAGATLYLVSQGGSEESEGTLNIRIEIP